jgi:hypothetical protein
MNWKLILKAVTSASLAVGIALPVGLAASSGDASFAPPGTGLVAKGPSLLGVSAEEARVEAAARVAAEHEAMESPESAILADLPADVRADVRRAVERLGPLVARKSHSDALNYAFRAFYNYRAAHPGEVRKPYLYFVDFGLGSGTARGYVFDMDRLTVVRGPFHVAHGRGSAPGGAATPTRFLNTSGSKATSLGLYLAQETYNFNGKSGGRAYRSVGLRLKGVSGNFNNRARARGIVAHGAPYVTNARAGRSEGCPAMPQALASELLPRIANGGMVFHFSPNDANWMRSDPWAAPGA